MAGTVFWDVDTQVDFMRPDGALYVGGSETIEHNLARLTEFARRRGIPIVGSVDHHDHGDDELSASPDFDATYPPHCIARTPGQEKVAATAPRNPMWIDSEPRPREELVRDVTAHDGEIIFRKQQFDVFSNPNVDPVVEALDPDEVVLFGVALDVCNAHAINGLLARGRRVTLVEDASRAIDPARGARMVSEWKARGLRVASTDEIVGGEPHAQGGS